MGASTLAIASLVGSALSTGVGVMGSIQQGKAAKAQADYQAAVSRNNQIIAQRRADDARDRGEVEAQDRKRLTALQIGRARAEAASRGVEVGSGSALEIEVDVAGIGAEEEAIIRNNAEREALGFEAEGMNFEAEAGLQELSGRNAQSAARSQAFGTALTGATSVASKWYTFKSEGAFT